MVIFDIDPSRYDAQLEAKRERIERQFARFWTPPLEVFASPPSHYRMRAEFRVWHEGDDLYYAMFEPDPEAPRHRGRVAQRVVRVDRFPVASERINELMPQLLDAIRDEPLMRRKLFQIEFLTTLSGEAHAPEYFFWDGGDIDHGWIWKCEYLFPRHCWKKLA